MVKINAFCNERVLCPGGHLLSPTLTTIGPCRLNDRVRDGNGCCPAGSATKTEDPFVVLWHLASFELVISKSFSMYQEVHLKTFLITRPNLSQMTKSQYTVANSEERIVYSERSHFRPVSMRVKQSSRGVLNSTLSEFAQRQVENGQNEDVLINNQ